MLMKAKVEARLCVEGHMGRIRRYPKKDIEMAEKDAAAYLVDGEMAYQAMWIETREVTPWSKLEGSETRR